MAADPQHKPQSAASANRRSFSVFSRRGHDAPSPTSTQSLVMAGMTLTAPSTPAAAASHSSSTKTPTTKKWRLSRGSSNMSRQGTLLRAVPQSSVLPPMTPLEVEMATSPNVEILRNIGMTPEESQAVSPVDNAIYFPTSDSPVSSRKYSMSRKGSNHHGDVIGLWVDGAVSWENQDNGEHQTQRPQSSSGKLLKRSSLQRTKVLRPKIQLVIPDNSSRMLSLDAVVPLKPSAGVKSPDHLTVQSAHRRTRSKDTLSDSSLSDDDENGSQCGSNRSSMTSVQSDTESQEQARRSNKGKSRADGDFVSEPFKMQEVEQITSAGSGTLFELVDLVRTPSTRTPHHSSFSGQVKKLTTLAENMDLDDDDSQAPSPTLSEAERNLESHLLALSEVNRWKNGSISRTPSVNLKTPPPPPPRSAKRLSRVTIPAHEEKSRASVRPSYELQRKSTLQRKSSVKSVMSADNTGRDIAANDAEKVIYRILSKILNLDDLFSMATINKGFYRVFKRNELPIIQSVLRNMSPAAWEYRQTCLVCDFEDLGSAIPAPEYTAASFYSGYMRDSQVIGSLKSIMLEQCRSLIRTETVQALSKHCPQKSSAVDDALWRIWTFSRIFGCDKGREGDISTQSDWLRGGLFAHQTKATSSFSSTDSWYASSALLNASEHFAKGNARGLSAEQLYDMTELWNCLRHISSMIIGQTEQARAFGVFDVTEIAGGDIDGEELALEDWHSYLLTLGLWPILQISQAPLSHDVFSIAKVNNWINWCPSASGSHRANFLREPVSRLYEERICESFVDEKSRSQELRQLRRQRGSSLAAELRQRKAMGLDEVPFSMDKPLSRANTVLDRLSDADDESVLYSPVIRNTLPPLPAGTAHALRDSYDAPSNQSAVHPAFRNAAAAPEPTRAAPPTPQVPAYGIPSYNDDSHSRSSSELPAYVPAAQHPFQITMSTSDPSVNSAEKAVFRIVEMGFTSEEAKGALKITDMGDGLRVDRAVEYLLRQAENVI